ncbi:hypothetical protein ACIRD2_25890 [Streptomyces sp. NPDC093595]|uniref:hypothetical protein n=1 Tax=Streptomyces sp. NPDC093595 TaxID=3366045 RepID=UPI0038042ED1
MSLLVDIGTRLGYAEKNIADIKWELVGVAHSLNLLKPEINGMVLEAVGANVGLKLFNFEHTVFDVKEKLAERKGEASHQLREDITKIMGPRGATAPGGVLGEHKKEIDALENKVKNARRVADLAQQNADAAKRGASRANAGVARLVSGAQRTGVRPATQRADLTSIRQAASAINILENRVNELVRSLSS